VKLRRDAVRVNWSALILREARSDSLKLEHLKTYLKTAQKEHLKTYVPITQAMNKCTHSIDEVPMCESRKGNI
jgi:hypothetical protein